MYAGRIVEEGPAEALLRDSRHPYTRALASAFPTIGDPASRFAPSGLPGDPPTRWPCRRAARSTPAAPTRATSARSTDVELRPAGDDGRRAACVLVPAPAVGAS